jgi:hypothetical protein
MVLPARYHRTKLAGGALVWALYDGRPGGLMALGEASQGQSVFDWISKVIDAASNVMPVHRWVDSVTNALKGLVVALILLVLVSGIFAMAMDGMQLFIAEMAVLALFALVILAISRLAGVNQGAGLYSPWENYGAIFGTESSPRRMKDASTSQSTLPPLPGVAPSPPQLTPPDGPQEGTAE